MNQFRDYDSPYEPPRSGYSDGRGAEGGGGSARKILLWVLILGGIFGTLGLLVCCGVPGFFFYLGKSMIENSTRAAIEDHPRVVEHIGEIQSLKINLIETGNLGRDGVFALDILGSRGSGLVISETIDGDPSRVLAATLRLPDGREFELLE